MNLKELNFLNSKTRRKIAAGAISVAMGFSIIPNNVLIGGLSNGGISLKTSSEYVKAFADEVIQPGVKKVVAYGSDYISLREDNVVYEGNTVLLTDVKDIVHNTGSTTFFIKNDNTVYTYTIGGNDKPFKVPITDVKTVVAGNQLGAADVILFLKNNGEVFVSGKAIGPAGLDKPVSTDTISVPVKMSIDNVDMCYIYSDGGSISRYGLDTSDIYFVKKDGTLYRDHYPFSSDSGIIQKIADKFNKVVLRNNYFYIIKDDNTVHEGGYLIDYTVDNVKDIGSISGGDDGDDGEEVFFVKQDGSVYKITYTYPNGYSTPKIVSGLSEIESVIQYTGSDFLFVDKNGNLLDKDGTFIYDQSGEKFTKDSVIGLDTRIILSKNNKIYSYYYNNDPVNITSKVLNGTDYTIDKIYNTNDQSKYGSWFTGFYSKSVYDDNDLMQFILNNTDGAATLSNGGIIKDESQIKNKYFLSNGSMILIDNYGMVQYYKNLTTASPATLSIDGSGIIGADTLVFGTGSSAIKHPVLYFASSSKYIDTDGSLKTFTLKNTDVKKMFAYKYANGVSQVMLVEKSDGSLVYFDKDGNQQDFGLNMNDVSYIMPATNVNKDIFVMKDGTLRDDKGIIATPDGVTLSKIWSNRIFEMSDGMLYTLQNGTFKNTNTIATFAKLAQNNALLLKNGNFQLTDATGNLTNDLDVAGADVKYMSQLDSTNMYLILNDGTTYGVGDKVQGDSLENHGVNINDVSAFLSNGSDNVVRALVTKDGTVYTNPGSWTKNTLVHFSSDAVNSAHESNPVYINPQDILDDYNNSENPDPGIINKLPGGTDEKNEIDKDLNPTVTDETGPILDVTGNPDTWTNKDVTLSVNASDEEGGSGFSKIILPDNSEITDSAGTFKVTENGTYTFKAVDKTGNEATQTVTVSKIDKAAPTVPSISNDSGTVTITAGTDADSGVKETDYSVNGGAYQKYTAPFTIGGGSNTVKAKTIDNAGNTSTEASQTFNVDKTAPALTITGNPTAWTNGDVTLNISSSDENGGSGLDKIILPDNSTVTAATGTFKVIENGTYTFKAQDKAGNITTQTVTVTKIDKAAPTTPSISNNNGTVTITAGTDADSGVKEVDYSVDGSTYQKYTSVFTLESGNHVVKAKTIDNAGNESSEAAQSITVEDTALENATQAVENAENTKKQEDVDSARDLVDALPDSPEKQDLEDRLDAVQDEIDNEQKLKDATDAVDHAEDTHSQEDLDHAKDLVDDLPDGPAKDGLEDRIDDIQDEIDQSSQEAQDLADATAAVEKAERTKTKSDYDTAVSKVSALKDGDDKTGLQGRLDKVKSDVDALIKAAGDAVTKAESTKTDEDINAAQGAIDKVPAGWDVSGLQDRLDSIRQEVEGQELAVAKAAVEKAEISQLQEDVNGARVLVNKLPYSQDRTDLNRRLDAVQNIINLYKNAEQRVQTAEKLKTEYAVSSARSVVSTLPAGNKKDSFNSRLDVVEAEIVLDNTIKAIDRDITALEKDVDSHIKYNTTMDIESYKGKVTALRDRIAALPDSVSDTKSAFNERLDSIDSKLTSQKGVQDAIEKVNDALDKAEQTLTDEDIQAAQDAIDALPDSVDKSGYESRFDIIKQKKQAKVAKDMTDANKAVTTASRTRLQADIDIARALVDKLPDGNNKAQLSKQLDLIQKYVKK